MVRVKVCGITTPEDGVMAAKAGADAVGLIFCASPRRVNIAEAQAVRRALPPFVAAVGVFVDEEPSRVREIAHKVGLTAVQLHGDEPVASVQAIARAIPVIKGCRVKGRETLRHARAYRAASSYLFDAYVKGVAGGTGHTFNWNLLSDKEAPMGFDIPWILAGGLTPTNVEEALSACRPYAVDVSSGVERSPGVKDPERVSEFIARVRRCHHEPTGTFWDVRRDVRS